MRSESYVVNTFESYVRITLGSFVRFSLGNYVIRPCKWEQKDSLSLRNCLHNYNNIKT